MNPKTFPPSHSANQLIGLSTMLLTLGILSVAVPNALKAQDSFAAAAAQKMIAEQTVPGNDVPDEVQVNKPSETPTRYVGTIDGTYYVTHKEAAEGPNFNVNSWNYYTMETRCAPDLPLDDYAIPAVLNSEVSKPKYMDLRYIPSKAFVQLSPVDQYDIVMMIKSDVPYGVYQSSFNDRVYKIVILTNTWKMGLRFDKQGKLTKVTKKTR